MRLNLKKKTHHTHEARVMRLVFIYLYTFFYLNLKKKKSLITRAKLRGFKKLVMASKKSKIPLI